MDYLGAEISKKIKSAIRAKLVELGVYVGEYIAYDALKNVLLRLFALYFKRCARLREDVQSSK